LLDSYEEERHAVGASTLKKTDLAFRYEIAQSLPARALRWLFVRLVALPSIQVLVLNELCGLALRYPPPSRWRSHRLIGRRAPDVAVEGTGGAITRLYDLLRERGFVLVDGTRDQALAESAAGTPGLAVVRPAGSTRLPDGMLVRPDGYVAWAGGPRQRSALVRALRRWCGEPVPAAERGRAPQTTPQARPPQEISL
jgi:hypothetical protein